MDPQQMLIGAQEAMAARRVFGDSFAAEGVTVLPVAIISGGGGGGGKGDEGGAGFGLSARASGVFVIRDGDVHWRPAIDVNRVVLGGQIVAITALLVLGPALGYWLKHRGH